MTTDPIASATLARLYLTQGHGARAQAILDHVLQRDPFDGEALALRWRLSRVPPRLAASFEDEALCLRWQGATEATRLHLLLALWNATRRDPTAWITSRPCTSAFGRHELAPPWARGVLVAALGRVDARGFAPQVVAEPLSWG